MTGDQKGFKAKAKPTTAQVANQGEQIMNELFNQMRMLMKLRAEQTAATNLLRLKQVADGGTLAKGDHVMLDFFGRLINEDGTVGDAFEGGLGMGYVVADLGSGTLVAGFEDTLLTMAVGSTGIISVTFPEDYAEALKGKKAQFEVTVLNAWRQSANENTVRDSHRAYVKAKSEEVKKEAERQLHAITK